MNRSFPILEKCTEVFGTGSIEKEENVMKKKMVKKTISAVLVSALAALSVCGCGNSAKVQSTGTAQDTGMSTEEILKKAAADGKIGNWGLGNEYQLEALLQKYNLPTKYLTQDFNMDGFDNGDIELASAMTYNELGLVKNSYDGAYGYGDTVGVIDFNDEGVAMLEDNLFCTEKFAEDNPNTVKAFVYATKKGWEYACKNPDEAAKIIYKYGSSVSEDHQKYMAETMVGLCTTDFKGNTVKDLCSVSKDDFNQTLELAKKYIKLDDASAAASLKNMSADKILNTSFYEAALASADGSFGKPEKTDVSMQLCWLPQAEFMGYYVAQDKGYYKAEGLNVKIISGGGDIAETTSVYNGAADFGTTMVSNMISADASGMGLIEIAQPFERSGMVLVYKKADFQ